MKPPEDGASLTWKCSLSTRDASNWNGTFGHAESRFIAVGDTAESCSPSPRTSEGLLCMLAELGVYQRSHRDLLSTVKTVRVAQSSRAKTKYIDALRIY